MELRKIIGRKKKIQRRVTLTIDAVYIGYSTY
jgi:hypothetical protein